MGSGEIRVTPRGSPASLLLALGLGAAWLAMRRFAPSAADELGPTRSRRQR